MKFIIERTSIWDNYVQPIETAYLSTVNYYNVRTLRSFEAFDKKFGSSEGNFTDKGYDHKINEEGYIQRTEKRQRWCIDIDDLEQLAELVKNNRIVIENRDYETPVIEIYDEHRE